MKKIILSLSAVVLWFAAGCSSSKMTKLEQELDAVVSKYDTAYWVNVDKCKNGEVEIMSANVDSPRANDTLLNELQNFCERFFSDVNNFSDVVFVRSQKIENNATYYICEPSQFSKYKFYTIDGDWVFIIGGVPFEKMRIKSGKVNIECTGTSSAYVVKDRSGSLDVIMPLLLLNLSDAEFEQL